MCTLISKGLSEWGFDAEQQQCNAWMCTLHALPVLVMPSRLQEYLCAGASAQTTSHIIMMMAVTVRSWPPMYHTVRSDQEQNTPLKPASIKMHLGQGLLTQGVLKALDVLQDLEGHIQHALQGGLATHGSRHADVQGQGQHLHLQLQLIPHHSHLPRLCT